MILSSVIIVLGEVLELTILASLFLALSFRYKSSRYWIVYAILTGSFSAVLYALSFDMVSQWFDGFGQEVINACIQAGIYISLLMFNSYIYVANQHRVAIKYLQWIMAFGIALAVTREGSEIYLYISGFMSAENLIIPVLSGSIVGAGIGISLGILIYYLLISLSHRNSLYLGYSLLLFVAAGMMLQAVRLLIQIDWLPAQEILWNTSNWIDESTITGRLLFTLLGYEATPTLIEIQFYIVAISGILIATAVTKFYVAKYSAEK